ncbi:MAG: acetyltransferase, partial [Niabella sp.]
MKYQLFTEPHHFFYRKSVGQIDLYIRSLQLEKDLPLIHKWVNMPYSSRFWQMQGSMEALYEYYQK